MERKLNFGEMLTKKKAIGAKELHKALEFKNLLTHLSMCIDFDRNKNRKAAVSKRLLRGVK